MFRSCAAVIAGALLVAGCKGGNCENDNDCKGNRVCQGGECAEPLLPRSADTSPAANMGAALVPDPAPTALGPAAAPNQPAPPRPAVARSPQVVVDEDLVASASGAQMRSVALKSSRPVLVAVEGKDNTGKGFNVYVMTEADWERFRSRRAFDFVQALSRPKTRSFSQTATLAAGTWCVVVENSENLLRAATVHLKVVVDP
jgi:hypothetical protein